MTSYLWIVIIIFGVASACGESGNDIRPKSIARLSEIVKINDDRAKAKALGEINRTLYKNAAGLGDPAFLRDTRDAWLKDSEDECNLEVRLRAEIGALEKTLKEHHDGKLPEWLRQDRDWQIIDQHIRKSDFRPPADGCAALYLRIAQTR